MIWNRHPSLMKLRAFALEAHTAGAGRRDTARHLEGCTQCRARVRWIQEVADDARTVAGLPQPSFSEVERRITAGDSVLLPFVPQSSATTGGAAAGTATAAQPQDPRRLLRGVWLGVAAAGVLLLSVGAIFIAAPDAGAEISDLRIIPSGPEIAQPVVLEYRATARLASESHLVVRARYRTAGPDSPARTIALGELRRTRGGRFSGTVALPDSAVYAVLAMEDITGRVIDDQNSRWEILFRDPSGKPLFEALRQRLRDAFERDTRLAAEVMQEMVASFPEEPVGWYFLHREETLSMAGPALDVLHASYRRRLPQLEADMRARGDPGAERFWYLIMHADATNDTVSHRRLVRELLNRYPESGAALYSATRIAANEHRGKTAKLLAALDSIWAIAPEAAIQPAYEGLQLARQSGDPGLIRKWAERTEVARPDWSAANGLMLVDYPATRATGMDRLRTAIASLAEGGSARPLSRTVDEHAADRAHAAGVYLAALGNALLASGQYKAALDTLDRALDTGWNASLFRGVGEARLLLGDTAAALSLFARFAADPNSSAASADSLRDMLGTRAHTAEWDAGLVAASEELREELLAQSLNRAPLRKQLRLRDRGGRSVEFRLGSDSVTVIAFWSPHCPASAADLPGLEAAAHRLAHAGIRFIGVPHETDAGVIFAYMERWGLSMPTYIDERRDARNAFDNRTTPYYVVLDRAGRIRFTSHKAEDMMRHVAVTGDLWQQ